MASNLTARGRQIALKMIVIQLVAIIFSTLIVLAFNFTASYSLMLGGLVCVIPNIFFALMVFRNGGAQRSKAVVRSFYVAESIKYLLTLGFFIAIFYLVSVFSGMVIFGYVIAIIANWVAIGLFKSTNF